MKLPVQRTGLPGHVVASPKRANELSFHIVPLDPGCKAGLTGHLPVEGLMKMGGSLTVFKVRIFF